MRILALTFIAAACVAAAGEVSSDAAGTVSFEAAGQVSSEELIRLARTRSDSQEFREAMLASLPEAEIKKGIVFVEVGPDFLCVVEADAEPAGVRNVAVHSSAAVTSADHVSKLPTVGLV